MKTIQNLIPSCFLSGNLNDPDGGRLRLWRLWPVRHANAYGRAEERLTPTLALRWRYAIAPNSASLALERHYVRLAMTCYALRCNWVTLDNRDGVAPLRSARDDVLRFEM